jgi:hypothetical protein
VHLLKYHVFYRSSLSDWRRYARLAPTRKISMRPLLKITSSIVIGSLMALSAGIAAQATEMVRVRGKIESFHGSTLVVKTREGETAKITLKDGWKPSSLAKASVDQIKPGDFVGVTSIPTADGKNGAVEVLIFPAAMKGTGEGSYAWDLKPNSTMTNATVANAVKSVDGHQLTLTYKGGEKTIAITDGTPIVTTAPATEADLKPGATVFVPSQKADDGTLTSSRVVVGKNGVEPPM